MTNSEFIKNLSLRLEKSQAETKRLLTISIDIFKKILDNDINMNIPGLGTFRILIRKKRKSFNPYHNRRMLLPPKRIVAFHPSSVIKKELKDERIEK